MRQFGNGKLISVKGFMMRPLFFPPFGVLPPVLLAGTRPASAQETIPVDTVSDLILGKMLMWTVPLIFIAGAIAFSMLAIFWIRRSRKAPPPARDRAGAELAQLRARLDEYEAILTCMPEVTLVWDQSGSPRMLGQPDIFGLPDADLVKLLNFSSWLEATDAARIEAGVKRLHARGENFAITVKTRDARQLRATGQVVGETTVLRLRNATPAPPSHVASDAPVPVSRDRAASPADDHMKTVGALVEHLPMPAWIRSKEGKLLSANMAYLQLCERFGLDRKGDKLPELFSTVRIKQFEQALSDSLGQVRIAGPIEEDLPDFDLSLTRLEGGCVGMLVPRSTTGTGGASASGTDMPHIHQVLDALISPMVIFDRDGRLKRFNPAYCELFDLDPEWLVPGRKEREIIDLLHRKEKLPATRDYQIWRTEHLKSYSLKEPRQEIWHLTSGRTIKVIATPDLDAGGVIYVFEDITEQLRLQSLNEAMLQVQRETLNGLNEAVAVFGTDGRLRLHNPQLSVIWKLPMNELGLNPHVDQIAQVCGETIPEEGEKIWQHLKRSIVDLDPDREDESGRIRREDGSLIDYAIIRLADSQTMLTFLDVTKSAKYEQVLKERNDALVTADRLKDAFVRNVSYELRSPLTSIIGFADLLASDSIGPLNEQQRVYTDYIRTSSATLGTLIDNILDLTHVDAGIAQLELEELDISEIIETARAGFAATIFGTDGNSSLNLKLDLADPAPRLVADRARMVQILYNLISNAARFSEPGADIHLGVRQSGDWVRIEVSDQGVGIPPELAGPSGENMGADTAGSLQREAGIGLTIVKAFVELHGGNLSMQTGAPEGNRIVVNLPRDASVAADHKQRV